MTFLEPVDCLLDAMAALVLAVFLAAVWATFVRAPRRSRFDGATMSENNPAFTSLSLQDRVAVLEDLVEFHRECAHNAALEILRIMAALRSTNTPGCSTDDLRAGLVRTCSALATLGIQLSSGALVTEETYPALKRWPFMVPPSALLS